MDESGQVLPAAERRFYPFGEYRLEPTADLTDRGFTGHLQEDTLDLVYMNARWYSGSANRFLTPDPIVPDPANPQSLNRYSYVLNNPLKYIDPSGHNPICNQAGSVCSDGAYDDGFQPIPDWWGDNVYIDGVGLFDTRHIDRGWGSAKYVLDNINSARASDGASFLMKSNDFAMEYYVSGDIADEQVIAIALGIYLDFEFQYELYQLKRPPFLSGFAPEDYPADYLGFWAYTNGFQRGDLPRLLNDLGPVVSAPMTKYLPFDITEGGTLPGLSLVRNFTINPMVFESQEPGSGYILKWSHVPWPEEYQMKPIESSSGAWQRAHGNELR